MRIPLSQQAERAIRTYIADHRLTPGSPLPVEAEFAAMLDMGKASVREGIRRLEMLGVVEVRHGRGLFVGRFSLDPVVDALPYQLAVDDTPIREILQVRAALEEGLIAHASKVLGEDDLARLDGLVERMRSESVHGEVPPDLDRQFHLSLYEPLGNDLLNRLIETFWQIYDHFDATEHPPINHHAVEDHAQIVDALRSDEPARMIRAIAVHFAPIQSTVELSDRSTDGALP